MRASHPSRVRGLKSPLTLLAVKIAWSHPSRVRGLKSGADPYHPMRCAVAPFAGAWIEIENTLLSYIISARVAPFAGAWIEIP